jgi:hypothetical protein
MKWYHWVLIAAVVLLVADDFIGRRLLAWRKRRETHITAERMRKWNVTAFRGARAVDKNRWLS